MAFYNQSWIAGGSLPADLVAYWKLNNSATDEVSANNLTITGATYTVTAQLGSHSLSFDGSGDYAIADHDNAFRGDNMTFMFWIKTNTTDLDYLLSMGDEGVAVKQSLHIRIEANGSIRLHADDGTNHVLLTSSGHDAGDDSWHHIACVYHASTKMVIIVDGTSRGSTTTSIPALLNKTVTNFGIVFGAKEQDGSIEPTTQLGGCMDDIRIYDTNMTAAEVSAVKDAELSTSGSGGHGMYGLIGGMTI